MQRNKRNNPLPSPLIFPIRHRRLLIPDWQAHLHGPVLDDIPACAISLTQLPKGDPDVDYC